MHLMLRVNEVSCNMLTVSRRVYRRTPSVFPASTCARDGRRVCDDGRFGDRILVADRLQTYDGWTRSNDGSGLPVNVHM